MADGARILVYDIENTPNLGYTWGKYRQNVIKFKEQWFMLSFAWKWLGERKVNCLALPDFDLYETEPHNDRDLTTALHKLMSQADIAVTHNGVAFDKKKAATRMAVHQLDPFPPRKEIDTLQVARRQFAFTSNRLGDLCQALGLPEKGDPGGWSTWEGCMDGDPKAWARMKRYNRRDIVTLEALYLRLRPWMTNHPNLNIYGNRPSSCPRCGHEDMIIRGYVTSGVTRRVKYQCNRTSGGCGGYSMGRDILNTQIAYRSV